MSSYEDFTAFESDALTKKPIDEQTQSTFEFIQQHESLLDKIHTANCETILSKKVDSDIAPIRFFSGSQEKVLPQDILHEQTQDHIRKVLIVFIFLADEIAELRNIAELRFYHPLTMFGQLPLPVVKEGGKADETPFDANVELSKTGRKEKMMGKLVPLLQELSNYIERCYAVLLNLVQQLSALCSPKNPLYRTTFASTHLLSMTHSMGTLLTILITLDAIIQNNETLNESWSAYKSMVAFARSDPSSFNTTAEQLSQFEQMLVNLDQKVLNGDIFRNAIEQDFESLPADIQGVDQLAGMIRVRSNAAFLEAELMHCMKTVLDTSMAVIGTNSELNERVAVVGAVGIYALYRRLLPPNQPPDAKLHKAVWGIQKTLPSVILATNVMWNIGDFITRHAHFDMKKLPEPTNPEAHRRAFLQQFDAQLSQRTAAALAQCKAWLVIAESRIQKFLAHESNPPQVLETYGNILLKGLALAKRVNYLARSALVMHTEMQVPMTKANINDIVRLLEMLKAMENTLRRKDQAVSEFLVQVTRGYAQQIHSLLQPMKLKMETIKKPDYAQMIHYSVLTSLEHLLQSSETYTVSRQKALVLLLEVFLAIPTSIRPEKDSAKITFLVNKIQAMQNYTRDISMALDTSFIYFHTELLPMIIHCIYLTPTECHRLQYVLSVYEDGIKLCQAAIHDDVPSFCINFRSVLRETLQSEIVRPLCRDIETDLRLHTHTKHLDHMQTINPKTENIRPLKPFLDIPKLRVLGILVDIKEEVTHYLDMNFYNLTTVALHDWRTYADMRSLAQEKFQLQLMDNFLPMGSLDQGLDVLQIMRNIHIFVSRFTYNINMQEFVEFRPDKNSKHVNTIKIQSIAASIRQHGLGVLNTTVNFTYQFLSSKFHIFSQFLFDDQIRRILSREHRFYRKHKHDADVNNQYPYERAVEVVKDIRKLGMNEQGKSFLDQFRILVTEIGNALGYVRMVRSASMYYCAEAVKYLPEFEDMISFAEYAGEGRKAAAAAEGGEEGAAAAAASATEDDATFEGAKLSPETVRAAENLDESINTLVRNFGSASDYFKILVNVFQTVLLDNNSNTDHLKNFYIIGKCMVAVHVAVLRAF